MSKNKINLYSLGCKVNQYDSACLGELLRSAGLELVENRADVAIIHTCAVTKSAISKNKRMINKARKENPRAKIVLAGCWPRVYSEDIQKAGVDMVVPDKSLEEVMKRIAEVVLIEKIPNPESQTPYSKKDRSRYFLKVQDGCEQFCAYCVIPYTRGKLYSRKLEDVLKEAKQAVKRGFAEIVVSGIHLGLYGINNVNKEEEEKDVDLVKLLKELLKIEGLLKIRLSSIEVTEVSNELIGLMAKEKKICKHLHISLQSGCDKILGLMKRPYDTGDFRKKIKELRQAMPDIAISTDVIVGFPKETKEDFLVTKDFLQEMLFSRLHVFSFSQHERTPAFHMKPKVSREEIKRRSNELRDLNEYLQDEYRKRFSGRELEVVIEAVLGNDIKGKTEYYFDVWFKKEDISDYLKNDPVLVGKVVSIKMD